MISRWVLKNRFNDRKVSALKSNFQKAKPFHYLEIDDFLDESKARQLRDALMKEHFELKESDLFKLMQTTDFIGTQNTVLKSFRDFLASKECIDFISKLTVLKLKTGVVDCSGAIYKDTHFLLAHDDRLDARSIAYIYYLSSLDKKDGGSLDLYSCKDAIPSKIEKSIRPKFNKLVLFEVSNKSFHQVAEIISNKDRIAIGGWFSKG